MNPYIIFAYIKIKNLPVLKNQYIATPIDPEVHYQIVKGSGIGLKLSSAVADSSFCHGYELTGPGIATQRFRRRFGVLFYARFRDHLLFLLRPQMDVLHASTEVLLPINPAEAPLPAPGDMARRDTHTRPTLPRPIHDGVLFVFLLVPFA